MRRAAKACGLAWIRASLAGSLVASPADGGAGAAKARKPKTVGTKFRESRRTTAVDLLLRGDSTRKLVKTWSH